MKNFKVTVNGKIYNVQVEEVDKDATEFVAKDSYNDNIYSDNNQEMTFSKDSITEPETKSIFEVVNSPMSGTITSIKVKSGQLVSKGEVLLNIEAIRMENEIMSPKDAIVSEIKVREGEYIDSGMPMIILRDKNKSDF